MVTRSEDWLRQHDAKQWGPNRLTFTNPPVVSKEKQLHDDVWSYCNQKGWLVIHSSMATATHATLGTPDFILLCDGGRVLFIECKSATGKLSAEQAGFHAWAAKLGTEVHVVRSMEEFIAVLVNEEVVT